MTRNSAENSAVWQWIGQILSGLVIFFLTMAAVMKLIPIAPVIETMNNLGFVSTPSLARGLGIFLLICTGLYTVPRTSLLGAVLLTGYFGGVIAIQLRAAHPLFSHILFGGYIDALIWTALLVKNKQFRKFIFAENFH
jgi:DoxX-like family